MEDYLIRLLKQMAMKRERLADFGDAVGCGVLLLLVVKNKCGVIEWFLLFNVYIGNNRQSLTK